MIRRVVVAVGLFGYFCAGIAAEDALPVIVVKPASINLSQSVEFDANGKPGHEESRFHLTLNGTYAAPLRVVEYGNVVVSEAVTDSGEKLAVTKDPFNRNRSMDMGSRRLSLSVQLPMPMQPCAKLTTVKGTMELTYTTAKLKEAQFSPLKDWLGKRVQIDGVEGGVITISRSGNGVRMVYNKATSRVFSDVKFSDSAGNDIETNGWGGGSNNDNDFNRDYHVELPDDAVLVLRLYQDLKTATVPFALADVPLPGHAPKDKQADAVIQLKDAGDGKPKAKPVGAAPDNF